MMNILCPAASSIADIGTYVNKIRNVTENLNDFGKKRWKTCVADISEKQLRKTEEDRIFYLTKILVK